ncbi:uncharacterized protein Z518_08105 [Rhinocladiella mackenziei CBS 650.93]|uniref:Rhinocladiella mackenziei CBS 650.93 unplaced genomic scaffold supercont1.6, whole genome shotgun sequence n=1 Tax=Rhinocladiella mackenziei CBS 650.93 TaxID=1442369 RepID=A0A0D2IFX2_9EURO|nr:uncharacterized protein Z518_08105 [Rhinocladiella mackenziei CBS 650.93]KIX02166.1 hypothetical protein Z518_08105 [Rhinocladiella mackenziei CBS 650.93]
MAEGEDSLPKTSRIKTYHCLCTTLILSTPQELEVLPRRIEPVQDGAVILAPPIEVTRSDEVSAEGIGSASSVLLNVVPDRRSVIIRRDDGFEKRSLLRCGRCKSVIGYHLDEAHFENSEDHPRPVYLLPGGLISTSDMAKGVSAEMPTWAQKEG